MPGSRKKQAGTGNGMPAVIFATLNQNKRTGAEYFSAPILNL
jgi:hypothetical protein